MQTLEQFGQTIKDKYPQYGDIPNTELGQKILSKYPEYSSQVGLDPAQTVQPYQPQQLGLLGFLGKDLTTGTSDQEAPGFLANLFRSTIGSQGVAGVGQAIPKLLATPGLQAANQDIQQGSQGLNDSASKLFDLYNKLPGGPEKEKVAQLLNQSIGQLTSNNQMMGQNSANQLTGKQALGTALNAGITGATLGGLPALTGGTVPLGEGAGALLKGLALKGAQSGVMGAGLGAAASLEKNQPISQVASNALMSGLISVPIGVALGLAQAGVSKLTEKGPEALMNDALDVNKKIFKAGKAPGKILADKGLWGDMGSLSHQVAEGMDSTGEQIGKVLEGSKEVVSTDDIFNTAVSNIQDKFPGAFTKKQIQAAVQGLPISDLLENDKLPVAQANQLKTTLDKMVGSGFYLNQQGGQETITASAKTMMSEVADAIRDAVKTQVPKAVPLFNDYGAYKTAAGLLSDSMAKAAARGFINPGLKDIGIGILFGGATGGLQGAGIGTAAMLAKNAITSPLAESGGAQLLNLLGKAGASQAGQFAGRVTNLGILKGIADNQ